MLPLYASFPCGRHKQTWHFWIVEFYLFQRIVSDSDHFHNKMHIQPEGYTAFRKFASVKGIYSAPNCHQACMKFCVPFWNSLLS
uniref:Uncharacterized protein n=1 Tax=Triticum urartu TaxID=4572 RepID=A0A8R7Q8V6_TRIUA